MNLLLIDDDDLFLFLTKRMLQKLPSLEKIESKNNIVEATNYLESCKETKEFFPDAIFVDMNMLGKNGMDFARFYNEEYAPDYPETQLVILTSSISRKEEVQALEIPAVKGFMQKPLTEEKLNRIMR